MYIPPFHDILIHMNETPKSNDRRDKYVDKVRKLLAKAEGAATQEEADTFLAKVTQLMAAWEIEDHELRGRGEAHGSDGVSEATFNLSSYTPKADAMAMSKVAAAMGLRGGFKPYRSGSPAYMRFIGRESTIERFTLLWTSLEMQMVRALKEAEPKGSSRSKLRTFRQSFKIAFAGEAARKIQAIRDDYGSDLVRVDREVDERADSEFGPAKRSSLRANYAGSTAGGKAGRAADVNGSARVGGSRKALGA